MTLTNEQKDKIVEDIYGSWRYQDTMRQDGKLWAVIPEWMEEMFEQMAEPGEPEIRPFFEEKGDGNDDN